MCKYRICQDGFDYYIIQFRFLPFIWLDVFEPGIKNYFYNLEKAEKYLEELKSDGLASIKSKKRKKLSV